jgi:acetate kinase
MKPLCQPGHSDVLLFRAQATGRAYCGAGWRPLIVFTGGIGENDWEARAEICHGLAWFGIGLDEARNRSPKNPISDPASRYRVIVLASQEDEQIARHTWAILQSLS